MGRPAAALFAAGRAGERFCVRNSGGTAVVEGIGDHGCEYMTNGTVVVIGKTGKNFGAGMSGGVAYLLDENGMFDLLHNPEMIHRAPMEDADVKRVQELIYRHLELTESGRAKDILDNWERYAPLFVKAEPKDKPQAAAEEVGAPADEEVAAKG